MTSSKDPEKHFPNLHIHILKTQAKRWIEKFPEAPVKRILLYTISFQLEGYMPEIIESYKPNPAIYAVVFEVDEEDKTINMSQHELMEYDRLCMCVDRSTWAQYQAQYRSAAISYERLWLATEPNLRKKRYPKLVTADFANVYEWPPKDNYLEEWRFIVKFKNAELNADIRTDEPHVVLWEREPQAREIPNDKYKSNNPEKIKPFPCEAGTKWKDVKITLIANDTVRIETPQGKGRYTYHVLKMADGRPGDKPKEVWATLKQFAKNQGIIPPKNHNYREPPIKALPEKAKHLNSHLKKLFRIKESIFKYHYKKHKRYETQIIFSDQTLSGEPEPRQDKSPFDSELDEINKKFGF